MIIDENQIYTKPLYAIAAVSEEKGVEYVHYKDDPINADEFKWFLQVLQTKNEHVRTCIFMDNLAAHKTGLVRNYMEENDIKYIYNVPYSPDFNPIEAVFSKVKSYFNKRKLNALANEKKFDVKLEMKQAFKQVKIKDVVNCAARSRLAMEKSICLTKQE